MADISKIKLPGSNTEYNIKDTTARDQINNILENLNTGFSMVTELPKASADLRGKAYILLGEVDRVYICIKYHDSYIWRSLDAAVL